MQTSPHRVRTQRWIVRARSAEDAFAWRKLLHDRGEDILLPALEKAFDEVTSGDEVLRIPRLELSIALGPGDDPAEKLPEMILNQIRDLLQHGQAVGEGLATPGAPGAPAKAPSVAGPFVDDRSSDGKVTGWQQSTLKEDRFVLLIRYLRTGSLPWHATVSGAAAIDPLVMDASSEDTRRVLQYLQTRREDRHFYFRLLQMYSGGQRTEIIEALSAGLPRGLKQALLMFITFPETQAQNALSWHARLHVASIILEASRAVGELGAVSEALYSVPDSLTNDDQLAFEQTVGRLPAGVRSMFQHELSSAAVDAVAQYPPKPLQALPSMGASTDERSPESDLSPLSVRQSGLVLLHPFLVSFFQNTGIIKADDPRVFVSPLSRVAALLHFVATGQEEVFEYELGFIKVLLGLAPETPLPVGEGLLTPGDRQEAEDLLRSVVKHWTALKNTSIDGLRSGFLQRPGLLREEDDGWRLQVERKPFDMLLDRLPWEFSVVKLPWMKRPVHTEW